MTAKNPTPILVADDMKIDTAAGAKRSFLVKAYGTLIARALHAPVDLVHVEEKKASFAALAFYGAKGPGTKSSGGQQGWLRRFIVEGDPAEEVLKLTRKRPKPQMLVMGTRARQGLKRLLLGSVTETVIRQSRLPVLTIGPKARAAKGNPFEGENVRLLVATDLSHACVRIEAYALALARELGARVTLLHSPFGEYSIYKKLGARLKGSGDLSADIALAMDRKKKLFTRHGIDCDVFLDTRTVFTHDSIVRRAAKRYACVIVGTHSRSALTRAMIGGTTREVIARSPIPVIVLSLRD